MKTLAEVTTLTKSFDGIAALDDFSCSIGQQEILGLIGPNGAGKTTFLNVLSGLTPPDRGNATFKGKSVIGLQPYEIAKLGVARTFQNLRLIRRLPVLENVLLCFQNQPGEHLHCLFLRHRACSSHETENRNKASTLLERVGLLQMAHVLTDDLSYGQQKLLSLVCCLAMEAELLLLDEPVAGIAPELIDTILSLIKELPSQGKSVIMVEHNVEALSRICQRAIFMDAGQKLCEGKPSEVFNDPRVIEAYLD
ncbi:MAG: ABC transporter ATP-binding protein [Acidobacteria bacterium]|nr:ABC transporter ATP-binding protein [Acidobacteriota bacterium]